jgi:hypothetical protein
MPSASITIDAVTGSNPPNGTPLVIGATVQLGNNNSGGELTYLWEWLDKPEGSLAAFSNPNIVNPTFIADVEGTYLIRLTVNLALASEVSDQVIAAVKQLKSQIRVPAAGEIAEESALRGWARDVNRAWNTFDRVQANPGRIVAITDSVQARGKVLVVDAMHTLKAGLPGEEKVPLVVTAAANSASYMRMPLAVMDVAVDGSTSVGAGELIYCTFSGVIGPLALGGGAYGDRLYVTDAGTVSITPGTTTRRIGYIIHVDGADYYVYVNGDPGHYEGTLKLYGNGDEVVNENYHLMLGATGVYSVFTSPGGAPAWEFESTGNLTALGGTATINNIVDPTTPLQVANKAYVDMHTDTKAAVLYWGNDSTPAPFVGDTCLDPGFAPRVTPLIGGSHPQIVVPADGVLSHLYIKAQTGQTGADVEFTVMVNGAPSTITCNLAATGTATNDTTHTAPVVAGDVLDIRLKALGVIATGAVDLTASLRFRHTQ